MIKRILSILILLALLVSCGESVLPSETAFTEGTLVPATVGDKDDTEMITEYFEGNALYTEKWRPYYHFTAKNSWLNDPNGLVYHNGTYHIYYQNNPYSNYSGSKHWGHATSTDLVCFEDHKPSLYPDSTGSMFSGTAYSDKENRSGLFNGVEGGGIIAAYSTSTQKIGIAYSVDGFEYKKLGIVIDNPGVKDFRDPKIFWDDISGKWTVLIAGGTVRFYQSDDLRSWSLVSQNDNITTECPDFFPMIVDGTNTQKWVLTCSSRHFYVGRWDGTRFIPETGKITLNYGPDAYAGLIIANEPKGRVLMISWMNNLAYTCPPDGVWNGANTLVTEMRLAKVGGTYVMLQTPIEEYSALENSVLFTKNDFTVSGLQSIDEVRNSAYKARFSVDLSLSDNFTIEFCKGDDESVKLSFDAKRSSFTFDRSSQLTAIEAFKNSYGVYEICLDKRYVSEGVLEFDVYIDTSSFEMYACDGAYLFTARIQPLTSSNGISISSSGSVRFRELTLIELKNIRGIDVENAKAVHLNRTEIVTTADCVEGEFVYASAYDGTDDYSVEIADASIARITKEKNGFYVYPLTEGNSEIKVTSGDRFIIIPLTVYSKSLLSTDIDAYSVTKATLEFRPDGILLSPAGGDGFALGDIYQKDLDFSSDVTPYNDSKAAALMFRAKDTNNFYCFTADYGAKVAKIWMKNAGTSTTLTSVKYDFEEGKTYNLRVKCTGKRIDAFINGERVITILNSVHSEGLLGLNAYNAPYIFNNVKVVSDASINVVSQISSYKSIVGTVGKSENGFYLSYGSGDGFAVSDVNLSDFEYSSDVKITNNTPAAALVFRYSEGNFYCATVDAGANVVKLWKRVNGATTVLRTVSAMIDYEKVYNVAVKADGKIIEIYLDDKLVIKAVDASHSNGRLGINVYKGGAFFNNIEYIAK